MLDPLDPPKPTGAITAEAHDAEVFARYRLDLITDDTKRCEAWVGSGPVPENPTPCPEPAAWFGALSCNVAHGVATCIEHRARIEDLVTRGAVVDCNICGSVNGVITWRAL